MKVRPEGDLLLPHLALLQNLAYTFAGRTVLAMHDGDEDRPTHLLALTRLITAREPEPEETSHLIRFADTTLVFGALWQVLQETNWPDARLAQLQHEWESVDFFTNLPAMERLEGASAVARCENARNERAGDAEGFVAFMETVLRFPLQHPMNCEAARRR